MDQTRQCSFCGKSGEEIEKLIVGIFCKICEPCIQTCNQILSDDTTSNPSDHFLRSDSMAEAWKKEDTLLKAVAAANEYCEQMMSGPDGHEKAVILGAAENETVTQLLDAMLKTRRYFVLTPTVNVSSPSKKPEDTRLRATSFPVNIYARVAILCRLKQQSAVSVDRWDDHSGLRFKTGIAQDNPIAINFRPTRTPRSVETFLQKVHHTLCTIEPAK